MNWLDGTILVTVGGCLLYSLWRGLVRELISLGSLVLASLLATRYCQAGAQHLAPLLGNERLAVILGFILILLSVIACGILLGRLAKGFIKKAGLTPLDKIFGAVLGFLKGAVIVAVLLMLLNFFPGGREIVKESRAAPLFSPLAQRLTDFLPAGLMDKLLKDIKRGVNHMKKYQKDLEKAKKELHENYRLEEIIPPALKENVEEGKDALEKDREKLRKLLRENL